MIKDRIGISEILIGGKERRMEAERRGREEETKGEGREEGSEEQTSKPEIVWNRENQSCIDGVCDLALPTPH